MSDPFPRRIHPPWTDDLVALLNHWQVAGVISPFVCYHENLPIVTVARHDGFHCPKCGSFQPWAYGFMADAGLLTRLQEDLAYTIALRQLMREGNPGFSMNPYVRPIREALADIARVEESMSDASHRDGPDR
jgi:hypothetical protein